MKKLILFLAITTICNQGFAQKFMTQSGTISFFSETPLENIEATNNQVMSVIDTDSGQVAFSLLMKAFMFEKALMQEHFNEKYVESDKYPKATFKGNIIDFNSDQLSNTPTVYQIKGSLTIHGVTKEIETTLSLQQDDNGSIKGSTEFEVAPEDYAIKIPGAVRDNIAKSLKISVKSDYEKMG